MAENQSFRAEDPRRHEQEQRAASEGGDETEKEEVAGQLSQPPELRDRESAQSELWSTELKREAETKHSEMETLAVPSFEPVRGINHCEGPLLNSSSESHAEAEFKDHAGVSQQQALQGAIIHNSKEQTKDQLQTSACQTYLSELSPTSVTQPLSSVPSPTQPDQRMSLLRTDIVVMPEADNKNSLDIQTVTAPRTVKASNVSDGYNWRKYGQKQVKSPKGSRSYYKCTHSECSVKKIECCDHSGHVIEIVCKGQHSHDPPRKTNGVRESRHSSSTKPVGENCIIDHPSRTSDEQNPATSCKELVIYETPPAAEKKRQNSGDSEGDGQNITSEEHINEPESKKRAKKSSLAYTSSIVKPGKKPKFVVHAAGDVGISGDGYRWRKYGQKMVKGNPHPRNYYRCTSAGCPVRKHIETAVDNADAVVITYKGIHDHDMPVPKKRHGPPSAPLVAAAAPASMSNVQLIKSDGYQNQVPAQWSADNEGELSGDAMDLGGEKAMESARTLLSIGFEIKPC